MRVSSRIILSVFCLLLAYGQFHARPAAAQTAGGTAASGDQAQKRTESNQGQNAAPTPPGTTPGGTVPTQPPGAANQGTTGPEKKTPPAPNQAVPTPKLTAITPAAPLIAPNQALTLAGTDFQDNLAVTLVDPQGNSYDLPSASILRVSPQRAVVVATLGIGGVWKAKATNPKGNASDPLEFSVGNSPEITLVSPRVAAFGVTVLIITVLLASLFIVVLSNVNKALSQNKWSLADALSEESAYQPKEIKGKQDVIMVASTSRLIALLGLLGILTTVLGIGYSVMWNLFIYGTVPDLTQVRSFLFGSASLFAPYLANQIGGVFSPSAKPKPPEAAPSTAITGALPPAPSGELEATGTPQPVSLTGAGFQPGLAVTTTDPQGEVHHVPPGDIQSVKPTLVVARLLLNQVGAWKVVVANPGGEPTDAFYFTVFGPPTISSTDPVSPVHNPSVEFTFVGTGFMSGLTVELTSPPPPPVPGAPVGAPPPAAPAPFAAEVVSVTYSSVKVKAGLINVGNWHAVITNPGKKPSNAFGFTVT